MLQFFNHYRKESQSEVYNLRFPQNVFRAKSVMPIGSCCWEICSSQDVCQQLQSGIQNNLEFRYIAKINIVSCQENVSNSADMSYNGRFLRYHTRAIISRGLYMFYPISKDHFFVFREVFSENSVLMYGLYSRAACNQEQLMMACVWDLIF